MTKKKEYLSGLINEYKLNDDVVITGYKETASCLLPLFDIYVISSLTEGLPLTLLEAMQQRVPIVATNVGGIPYVVEYEQSAIIIKPKMAKEISSAHERLITDKKLGVNLADQAFVRYKTEYTSSIMASKYLKLYSELVNAF